MLRIFLVGVGAANGLSSRPSALSSRPWLGVSTHAPRCTMVAAELPVPDPEFDWDAAFKKTLDERRERLDNVEACAVSASEPSADLEEDTAAGSPRTGLLPRTGVFVTRVAEASMEFMAPMRDAPRPRLDPWLLGIALVSVCTLLEPIITSAYEA